MWRHVLKVENVLERKKNRKRMDVGMEKTYCAEIKILNGTTVYMPAVEDGIEWVTERKGTPGKLTFSVLDDGKLDIREGNAVQFRLNGQDVFWGYIFIKKKR